MDLCFFPFFLKIFGYLHSEYLVHIHFNFHFHSAINRVETRYHCTIIMMISVNLSKIWILIVLSFNS